MDKLFPHCYRALRLQGYPPQAARRTLLAARHGDQWALIFVRVARSLNRSHMRDMVEMLNLH